MDTFTVVYFLQNAQVKRRNIFHKGKLLEKNIKYISVRDAIDTLAVPHLIASDIANEHDYQIDLYFEIVIEPNIVYTDPNQY